MQVNYSENSFPKINGIFNSLNAKFPSYKLSNLLYKSIDWFLYNENFAV